MEGRSGTYADDQEAFADFAGDLLSPVLGPDNELTSGFYTPAVRRRTRINAIARGEVARVNPRPRRPSVLGPVTSEPGSFLRLAGIADSEINFALRESEAVPDRDYYDDRAEWMRKFGAGIGLAEDAEYLFLVTKGRNLDQPFSQPKHNQRLAQLGDRPQDRDALQRLGHGFVRGLLYLDGDLFPSSAFVGAGRRRAILAEPAEGAAGVVGETIGGLVPFLALIAFRGKGLPKSKLAVLPPGSKALGPVATRATIVSRLPNGQLVPLDTSAAAVPLSLLISLASAQHGRQVLDETGSELAAAGATALHGYLTLALFEVAGRHFGAAAYRHIGDSLARGNMQGAARAMGDIAKAVGAGVGIREAELVLDQMQRSAVMEELTFQQALAEIVLRSPEVALGGAIEGGIIGGGGAVAAVLNAGSFRAARRLPPGREPTPKAPTEPPPPDAGPKGEAPPAEPGPAGGGPKPGPTPEAGPQPSPGPAPRPTPPETRTQAEARHFAETHFEAQAFLRHASDEKLAQLRSIFARRVADPKQGEAARGMMRAIDAELGRRGGDTRVPPQAEGPVDTPTTPGRPTEAPAPSPASARMADAQRGVADAETRLADARQGQATADRDRIRADLRAARSPRDRGARAAARAARDTWLRASDQVAEARRTLMASKVELKAADAQATEAPPPAEDDLFNQPPGEPPAEPPGPTVPRPPRAPAPAAPAAESAADRATIDRFIAKIEETGETLESLDRFVAEHEGEAFRVEIPNPVTRTQGFEVQTATDQPAGFALITPEGDGWRATFFNEQGQPHSHVGPATYRAVVTHAIVMNGAHLSTASEFTARPQETAPTDTPLVPTVQSPQEAPGARAPTETAPALPAPTEPEGAAPIEQPEGAEVRQPGRQAEVTVGSRYSRAAAERELDDIRQEADSPLASSIDRAQEMWDAAGGGEAFQLPVGALDSLPSHLKARIIAGGFREDPGTGFSSQIEEALGSDLYQRAVDEVIAKFSGEGGERVTRAEAILANPEFATDRQWWAAWFWQNGGRNKGAARDVQRVPLEGLNLQPGDQWTALGQEWRIERGDFRGQIEIVAATDSDVIPLAAFDEVLMDKGSLQRGAGELFEQPAAEAAPAAETEGARIVIGAHLDSGRVEVIHPKGKATGYLRNRDMPGEANVESQGELFFVERDKDGPSGLGFSLAKDALRVIRGDGAETVILRNPSTDVGKALVQRLIGEGIIGPAIKTAESGTSLHRLTLPAGGAIAGRQQGLVPETEGGITGAQRALLDVDPEGRSELQQEVDADEDVRRAALEADAADVAPTAPLFGEVSRETPADALASAIDAWEHAQPIELRSWMRDNSEPYAALERQSMEAAARGDMHESDLIERQLQDAEAWTAREGRAPDDLPVPNDQQSPDLADNPEMTRLALTDMPDASLRGLAEAMGIEGHADADPEVVVDRIMGTRPGGMPGARRAFVDPPTAEDIRKVVAPVVGMSRQLLGTAWDTFTNWTLVDMIDRMARQTPDNPVVQASAQAMRKALSDAKGIRGDILQNGGGREALEITGSLLTTKTGKAVTDLQRVEFEGPGDVAGVARWRLIAEGKLQSGARPPTPEEQRVVDAMTSVFDYTGALHEVEGTMQYDHATDTWRPFVTPTSRKVVPRLSSPALVHALWLGEGWAGWQNMIDWIAWKNGMAAEEVKVILNKVRADLKEPTGEALIRRISAEVTRAFPHFPTHIKMNVGTANMQHLVSVELLISNPFAHVQRHIDMTANRLGFIRHMGQDIPGESATSGPTLSRQLAEEVLADPKPIVAVMRSIHGLPVDTRFLSVDVFGGQGAPGTIIGQVIRGIGHVDRVLTTGILSGTFVPNIVEPLGAIQTTAGGPLGIDFFRVLLKYHLSPTSYREARTYLEQLGAVEHWIRNRSLDPNNPVQSAATLWAESGPNFLTRFFWRRQETLPALIGLEKVARMEAGRGSDSDAVDLQAAMGWSPEKARSVATNEGGNHEAEYLAYMRRVGAFTTNSPMLPAEQTALEHSNLFRVAVRFVRYAFMKNRNLFQYSRVLFNASDRLRVNPRGGREWREFGASAKQWSRVVLGTTLSGVGMYFLWAFLRGGLGGVEQAAKEANADRLTFFIESWAYTQFAGPFGAMLRVERDPSRSLWEDGLTLLWPIFVLKEWNQAIKGTGRYRDRNFWWEPVGDGRFNMVVNRFVPITDSFWSTMALVGFGAESHDLDQAVRAYWRIRRKIAPFVATVRGDMEQSVLEELRLEAKQDHEFRLQMRRASDAIAEGVNPLEFLNAALRVRGASRKDVSRRLMNLRLLKGKWGERGTPENDGLRARLTKRNMGIIRNQDQLLKRWADSYRATE